MRDDLQDNIALIRVSTVSQLRETADDAFSNASYPTPIVLRINSTIEVHQRLAIVKRLSVCFALKAVRVRSGERSKSDLR